MGSLTRSHHYFCEKGLEGFRFLFIRDSSLAEKEKAEYIDSSMARALEHTGRYVTETHFYTQSRF